MNTQIPIWLTVLGMALVTAACRFGGYFLISRHRPGPRLSAALSAVPGAVLTALIIPALSAGPAETAAGIATLAVAWRLPPLAAIAIGTATVVLLRHTIGG